MVFGLILLPIFLRMTALLFTVNVDTQEKNLEFVLDSQLTPSLLLTLQDYQLNQFMYQQEEH